MSSSYSPCAACKFLRRKCAQECIFAPYFPQDQPEKFASVHKVFGASNVAKLLNEIHSTQREYAVNSLAFEADERLRNPVYGCVGFIYLLQQRLKEVQSDLFLAKQELAQYIGPSAMLPILQPNMPQQHLGNPSGSNVMPHNVLPMMGIPTGQPQGGQLVIREHPQQQQFFEAHQQLAAASSLGIRDQPEMFRTFDQPQQQQQQKQQQQEILRFNSGFDGASSVTAIGCNQLSASGGMSPSLVLATYDNPYQIQPQVENQDHHHQIQGQLLLLPQQHQQQPQQRSGREEGRSTVGPSS